MKRCEWWGGVEERWDAAFPEAVQAVSYRRQFADTELAINESSSPQKVLQVMISKGAVKGYMRVNRQSA